MTCRLLNCGNIVFSLQSKQNKKDITLHSEVLVSSDPHMFCSFFFDWCNLETTEEVDEKTLICSPFYFSGCKLKVLCLIQSWPWQISLHKSTNLASMHLRLAHVLYRELRQLQGRPALGKRTARHKSPWNPGSSS